MTTRLSLLVSALQLLVLGAPNARAQLPDERHSERHEARAQILIPQAYLPSTGGVITGIEVVVTSATRPGSPTRSSTSTWG
jgi:hypothetical protein